MKNQTEIGKVNGLTIAFTLVAVAIIGLLIVPGISNNNETRRLEAEVNRVADETDMKPSSVACSNVELANICYVEYVGTSSSIENMLKSSGYSTTRSKTGRISATNQSTSVRVDSETTSPKDTITLKYKDIDVTL